MEVKVKKELEKGDTTLEPVDSTPEEQLEQAEIDSLEKEANDLEISGNEGKNILIMLSILIGVFVLVFAGFSAYNYFNGAIVVDVDQLHQDNLDGELSDEEGYFYNGFSFVKVDGLWWTEINGYGTKIKIPLHFGPKELEDVNISGQLGAQFNAGNALFITFNPDVRNKYYNLASSELIFNIAKGLEIEVIGACTKNASGCDNRTIISCKTARNLPVIEMIEDENETGIILDSNCIKIIGNDYDIVKAADRLLYQWYGIMK